MPAQLDALALSAALRRRLTEVSLDRLFVREEALREACRAAWSGPPGRGGLVSDLWVEGAFPVESAGTTLDDLVREGLFSSDLRDLLHRNGAVPRDRPLYTHQETAVRHARGGAAGDRPGLVVTAPTGAGKTESFLLPMLDDLWRSRPDPGGGMSCLILYPMNALVNDQVDRLDRWLATQDGVRLFHFTSETPEDWTRLTGEQQEKAAGRAHRVHTRQQARGAEDGRGNRATSARFDGRSARVPEVVVTNYSMLEYMLCRPQDAGFFGPNLRTVVLDEAHLYAGTLAAEISLLLRRVLSRCGVDPAGVLQVATSATLGGGDRELCEFIGTLFNKPADAVRAVRGRRDRGPDLPPAAAPTSPAGLAAPDLPTGPTLAADPSGEPELAEVGPAGTAGGRRRPRGGRRAGPGRGPARTGGAEPATVGPA